MGSKIDTARTKQILSSDGSADRCPRLILLGFTRCPKEMRCALLGSPLAAEMLGKGVELEPEWAEGRLILAQGVTAAAVSEAREMWHVAVRTVDEDKVHAILKQSLPCKIRPKLKGSDGRLLMPEGTSLFGDVSEGSISGY